jgi:cytoskeletal protein RodZ
VFGRKSAPPPTQSQVVMEELAQSYGHLRQAAGHLAGGAAEKITPTYDRARAAANRRLATTKDTFSPMYEQMREGAANARKARGLQALQQLNEESKPNRWPALFGLLATGAAVGAVGAMIVRRRRAAEQWEDYDPMTAIDEAQYGDKQSPTQKVTAGAASVADSVSSQASKLADSLHEKSGTPKPDAVSTAKDKASGMADTTMDKTESMAESAKRKSGSMTDPAASKAEDIGDRP